MDVMQEIATLRAAAQERTWNILQPTLTSLLGAMGVFPALEIAVNTVNSYLPTFERYHPADSEKGRILRELVVSVVSFGYAPDRLPEHLTGDYDTPGSGQFANAVLELCRAMQGQREPAEKFDLLASAIANTILAELAELWYSQNPEAYQRVRANHVDPETGEYSDPEAARIPLAFWIDPEVAARDTAAWLRVADAIEAKFKPGAE